MGIVGWIIIGGLAGWLAGLVMGDELKVLWSVLIGMAGAFLGGLIFNLSSSHGAVSFSLWDIFVAFVGSLIVLLAVHLLYGVRGTAS